LQNTLIKRISVNSATVMVVWVTCNFIILEYQSTMMSTVLKPREGERGPMTSSVTSSQGHDGGRKGWSGVQASV
jgi:hypothetical protein